MIWDFILTSTSIDSIRFLLEGEHELAVWVILYDTGNNELSNGGNDIGDMLLTWWWWQILTHNHYGANFFLILMYTLLNVQNRSPTFQCCNQHKPSPTSVTNIDVTFIHQHTKIRISWSSRLKSGSLCSKIRNREEINFKNLIF